MKKLVIALMAFALVITLAGCGGGGGGSSYHLDYGDEGAGLKDYGDGRDLTPIKKAYDGIKTELAKYNTSNDPEGKERTAAIMYYISEKYSGGVYKHKDGKTRDMSKPCDNNMGYYISESNSNFVKLIEFERIEEDTEDE